MCLKNKMTKSNLFKIIAIVFLLLMLVGLAFFRKDDGEIPNSKPTPTDNQQVENPDKKYELTEKEKVKIFAENFTATYYSYTWGNFSNVESQYYYMTEEMKNREENKVRRIKREVEEQPRKYFTVRAEVDKSEFIEFVENIKVSMNISLKIKEINGAFVIDTEVPEIKPHTTALVDGNKNVYEGDIEDLIIDTVDKSVQINLIKIGGEWKVDWIGEN